MRVRLRNPDRKVEIEGRRSVREVLPVEVYER
jgi:hypothetical protein